MAMKACTYDKARAISRALLSRYSDIMGKEMLSSFSPDYDVKATTAELDAIDADIRSISRAINSFEDTFIISDEFPMTASEAITYLKQLEVKLQRLGSLRSCVVPSKMPELAAEIDSEYIAAMNAADKLRKILDKKGGMLGGGLVLIDEDILARRADMIANIK